MTRAALRRWFWVHKWTSLVCTAFLLVVCIIGMPLVVRDEISNWLDDGLPYASVPTGTPNVSLDRLADISRQMYPGQIIISGEQAAVRMSFIARYLAKARYFAEHMTGADQLELRAQAGFLEAQK